jgi:hypothetical protein
MSKPSSYDLLIQIHKSMNHMEDKMDRRLCNIEDRVDKLETFRDNLNGKIAMGVITVGAFISVITSVITTWINNRVNR